MDIYLDFLHRINSFVGECLNGYTPKTTNDKVIHDPIWGSVVYKGWEIQIIDSPLFQRLRDISQLGAAELTYPAARHSRMEHSLGVVAIAQRMIQKLRERSENRDFPVDENIIGEHQINQVRLAALLHDIGHCCFSHLAENVYRSFSEFNVLHEMIVKNALPQKINPNPHELFSYCIIKSANFIGFFEKYIDFPQKTTVNITELLDQTANMVIGVFNIKETKNKPVHLNYLTNIINGDFDADKLDYTQRDSYTAGLSLTYGVERFLLKIDILRLELDDYTEYHLSINTDAVAAVEELIFNRQLLYGYIYRHQKVLAAECVIKDILTGMIKSGNITHPADFLRYNDNDIRSLQNNTQKPFGNLSDKSIGSIVKSFKSRKLPKRCLTLDKTVISTRNISMDTDEILSKYIGIIEKADDISEKKSILKQFAVDYTYSKSQSATPMNYMRQKIKILNNYSFDKMIEMRKHYFELIKNHYEQKNLPVNFDLFDLYICLPKLSDSLVKLPIISKNGTIQQMEQVSYLHEWLDAFNENKWRGFIFVNDNVDKVLAQKAAIELFEEFAPDIRIN